MIAEIVTPDDVRIWARCERNPKKIAGLLSLSREEPPAEDTIKLAYDIDTLHTAKDVVVMRCAFSVLKLLHLVDLLNIVHTHQPFYALASYNCW